MNLDWSTVWKQYTALSWDKAEMILPCVYMAGLLFFCLDCDPVYNIVGDISSFGYLDI